MTDYLLTEGVQFDHQYQHNQTDSLLGTATQGIPNLARFFQFREDGIEETFNFTFEGQPGVFDSIGDGGSYSAYLFDLNGNIAGTKDASFILNQQLENGDLLASVQETINLPEGQIFTQGTINATATEHLIPQSIPIVCGTSLYSGAFGIETVRQLELGVLDVFDITLAFAA